MWEDFERSNVVQADLNKDGITTDNEMKQFRNDWMKRNGLTAREGDVRLYDRDGRQVSVGDIRERFASDFE